MSDSRAAVPSETRFKRWTHYGTEFLGTGFLRLQLILLLVLASVLVLFVLFGRPPNVLGSFIFTFFLGNWTALVIGFARPLFVRQRAPWNWIVYIPLLVVAGGAGSFLADLLLAILFSGGHVTRIHFSYDAPLGVLVTLIFGVLMFVFAEQRGRMEGENRQLQGQVQLGIVQQRSHEAELEQAHEIQRHLLPRETPQIAGFQIACAWQPARAVSGDYFDVLPLGEGRLGLCIADVSGKGITAALLMANLQASVKAFAHQATTPAELCAKLNSVLCETVAPGKFVTFFYGILDSQQRQLHYENAGHCLPLVVHADGSILMPASYSGVLGLFSHWTFQDSELQLQAGDCLVLMTDGVLEAADEAEEEFGYQRLIEAVAKSRGSGAHGIRTAILEAVSRFCAGKFDDDASLIVLMVD